MNIFNFKQLAPGSVAAVAVLAGCAGSPVPSSSGFPVGSERLVSASPARDRAAQATLGGVRSWIAPDARSKDLLYVTNYSYVTIYTYPQAKLVGYLHSFKSTVGECVDQEQNIYITNYVYKHGSTRIAEYAHGGTKPIAVLQPTHVGPVGCSVDPTTGNLAVSGSSGVAGVDIFRGAKGKPTFYKVPFVLFTQFCAYDAQGDLFVDGLKDSKGDYPFAMLTKGSSRFVNVKLGVDINEEGGVQWDGRHVAVAAFSRHKHGEASPLIDQFTIHGSRGKRVGTTVLGSPANITLQFFILNSKVIVPNWYFVSSSEKKNVLIYDYPQGGSPIMEINKHSTEPRGVAVSVHS